MQKNFSEIAQNFAQEMIKSYYVDKNVDGVCNFLDKNNFSFSGFTDGKNFNSVENFRDYLQNSLDLVKFYQLRDENYSVTANSADSCIVNAKISLFESRTQKIYELQFYFYFVQAEKILCRHYHVVNSFKAPKKIDEVFLNKNFPSPQLSHEIQSLNEDFIEFLNSLADSEKNFDGVNPNLIKILRNSRINNFLRQEYAIHIKKNIILYPRLKHLKIDEKIVEFTSLECEIFMLLLENLNKAVSIDEIYKKIWNSSFLHSTSNVLPTHINNIRRKIKNYDSMKIFFIRNEGYRLEIK